MIALLFSREDTLVSKGIRLITKSQWSHVDIIIKDTFAIGAQINGVTLRTIKEAESYDEYELIRIDSPNNDESFVVDQLDKPYDWLGLLGLEFGVRDWQDDSKWFCSELAATYVSRCGIAVPWSYSNRVTPGMLYDFVKGFNVASK